MLLHFHNFLWIPSVYIWRMRNYDTASGYYLLLSVKEGFLYHTGNLIYQQNCCRCHLSKFYVLKRMTYRWHAHSIFCLFMHTTNMYINVAGRRLGRIMTKHTAPNLIQNVAFCHTLISNQWSMDTIQKKFLIWISRSFKKGASDNTISYFDQSPPSHVGIKS